MNSKLKKTRYIQIAPRVYWITIMDEMVLQVIFGYTEFFFKFEFKKNGKKNYSKNGKKIYGKKYTLAITIKAASIIAICHTNRYFVEEICKFPCKSYGEVGYVTYFTKFIHNFCSFNLNLNKMQEPIC